MAYDVGDVVRFSALFTDPENNDAAIDPPAVQFKIRLGTGTVTTYNYGTDNQLVKDGTGRYHVDISMDTAGTYYARFSSSGSYQAAVEDRVTVRASHF